MGLRIIIIALTTLSIFFSTVTKVNANESSSKSMVSETDCHLLVGWGEWPPYQKLVEGSPTGIQIDLIKNIADLADCTVSFKLQTFSENLKSTKSGSVDLIFDTTITSEREEYSFFSIAYRNEIMALYVRPTFLAACRENEISTLIADGFRLGVTEDNFYGDTISQIQANPEMNKKLVYRGKNLNHLELFKQNKIDGLIEDPLVMAYSIRHDSEIGKLNACMLSDSASPLSLMFSKKNVPTEIVQRFNDAIRKIKLTTEYQKTWN